MSTFVLLLLIAPFIYTNVLILKGTIKAPDWLQEATSRPAHAANGSSYQPQIPSIISSTSIFS
jgi:hypothetical protein